MSDSRLFTMLDEPFVCGYCGASVAALGKTARDHCNKCLCSVHIDVNPGDRAGDCGGKLVPVGILPHKKGRQIVYRCVRCGAERRNVAAYDDDFEVILAVTRDAAERHFGK
ncbi:hypothetical protein FACS1894133_1460 [Clostridia bacterium]|nr:hypothetical protein FACS1894133_1460 [Clostridia bacterium]